LDLIFFQKLDDLELNADIQVRSFVLTLSIFKAPNCRFSSVQFSFIFKGHSFVLTLFILKAPNYVLARTLT